MRGSLWIIAAGLALAGAGCGTAEREREGDQPAEMGGMEGMPGVSGDRMMDQMRSHLTMMERADPDSLQALRPVHRQMVANMIAQMNREMGEMGMEGDAAWQATVDSLRQDLVRMPEMNTRELADWMPAHRRRVMRLMEMHQSMMDRMEM